MRLVVLQFVVINVVAFNVDACILRKCKLKEWSSWSDGGIGDCSIHHQMNPAESAMRCSWSNGHREYCYSFSRGRRRCHCVLRGRRCDWCLFTEKVQHSAKCSQPTWERRTRQKRANMPRGCNNNHDQTKELRLCLPPPT